MFYKTIAAAAVGAVLLSASPALADDAGLYGADDPTYDGVYRQSLAILSLEAADRKVPKSSITWLKQQQCSNGGFMAYRSDVDAACQAPDAVNFTGQDSNSTALAAAALYAHGDRPAAKKAVKWLLKRVNPDGGWAYYPAEGSISDANSTALAVGAVELVRGDANAKYLRKVQLRCSAEKSLRGALAYDTSSPEANDNATSQAAWTLTGGLGVPAPRKISTKVPNSSCSASGPKNTAKRALNYLNARLLTTGGELPYGGGFTGTDYAGSAMAAIALAQSGAGKKAVKKTSRFLQKSAETWVTANGNDSPAALAMLSLVATASGENPKDFGGINLPSRLAKTRQ